MGISLVSRSRPGCHIRIEYPHILQADDVRVLGRTLISYAQSYPALQLFLWENRCYFHRLGLP